MYYKTQAVIQKKKKWSKALVHKTTWCPADFASSLAKVCVVHMGASVLAGLSIHIWCQSNYLSLLYLVILLKQGHGQSVYQLTFFKQKTLNVCWAVVLDHVERA